LHVFWTDKVCHVCNVGIQQDITNAAFVYMALNYTK